jgi:protease-4
MNRYTRPLLSNVTVLNAILTDQWLMSHTGLLQMGHFFKSITEKGEASKSEADRSEGLLNFYNDDDERIHPSNIGEIPEGSIAHIRMIGPMMKYGNWWMVGADEIIWQLDFVNRLQNVVAIVVEIDGPGGAVSAIPPFIEFAKRKNKPIVALCDSSLSLHRWIPDAIADYQMADNNISARFGSVGVVSSWMDISKYYEELGVKIFEVYPEESEHKNEIWRTIQDDEEKGLQMLREMHLSPMAIQFQDAVKKAHPNLVEEEGVLTGRTFSTEDAIRVGMINKQGSMKEAMQIAKALADAYILK